MNVPEFVGFGEARFGLNLVANLSEDEAAHTIETAFLGSRRIPSVQSAIPLSMSLIKA